MRTPAGYSKDVHAGNGVFTRSLHGDHTVLVDFVLVLMNREICAWPGYRA